MIIHTKDRDLLFIHEVFRVVFILPRRLGHTVRNDCAFSVSQLDGILASLCQSDAQANKAQLKQERDGSCI